VGGGTGRLGDLVLAREARGSGTGRRLIEVVLDAARAAGYERLELATFSDLSAARSLYLSVGFVKVSGERTVRWGRVMEWERYELAPL
jgi:putative acetyltransferase